MIPCHHPRPVLVQYSYPIYCFFFFFFFFFEQKKKCVSGVEGPGQGVVRYEALSRTTIILEEFLRSLSGQIAPQVSYLINIDMRGWKTYRILSLNSLAPLVANLRIHRPRLLRRISAFPTRSGMSRLAVLDLINCFSQFY